MSCTADRDEQTTNLALTITKTDACISTRVLAAHLGIRHDSLFELVRRHRADFEELGILRFQTGEIQGRGQPKKFALLTEDQAYLLLTYSRNTARVRALKVRLVKAFREARIAADTRASEYLPAYHRLHQVLHDLACGSANVRFVHANMNRLVNKAAGVASGQRDKATLPQRSLLTVAQAIATSALQGAPDHHEGYQRVKRELEVFEAMTGALRTAVETNGQ